MNEEMETKVMSEYSITLKVPPFSYLILALSMEEANEIAQKWWGADSVIQITHIPIKRNSGTDL